jgi:hypothetical protein
MWPNILPAHPLGSFLCVMQRGGSFSCLLSIVLIEDQHVTLKLILGDGQLLFFVFLKNAEHSVAEHSTVEHRRHQDLEHAAWQMLSRVGELQGTQTL